MKFSLNSILIKFLLATEFPTHRHSRRLKDTVETLPGDPVDYFEHLKVPVETSLKGLEDGDSFASQLAPKIHIVCMRLKSETLLPTHQC